MTRLDLKPCRASLATALQIVPLELEPRVVHYEVVGHS